MVIYLKSFLNLLIFFLITNGLLAQTIVMHDSTCSWNYNYQVDDAVELKLFSRSIDVQYHNNEIISQTVQSYDQGNWNNSMKITNQYNPNMSVTSELIQVWIEGEWTNCTHRIHEYDSDNNEKVRIFSKWEQNQWEYDHKYEMEWVDNCMISSVYFIWFNGSWLNSNKTIKTYTINGNLETLESFTWNSGTWENNYRHFYYYDDHFREIKHVKQYWLPGAWSNQYQTITNYNPEGNIESIYDYVWSNQDWVENERVLNEYDASQLTMTSIFQHIEGDDWNNDTKGIFTKYEDLWILIEGNEWRDDQWCKNTQLNYSLNSENEVYALATKTWTDSYNEIPGILSRWDSTVWYASDHVGEEEILRQLELFAYPNPSKGTLRILTDLKPTTLYVYNTAGNLVRRIENIFGGIIDIDLIDEPRGMYFINCCSGNDSKSVKVLLE